MHWKRVLDHSGIGTTLLDISASFWPSLWAVLLWGESEEDGVEEEEEEEEEGGTVDGGDVCLLEVESVEL